MFRQLIYTSVANPPGTQLDLDAIYNSSRHGNALDGVTGLLLTDGQAFCQVLEGPDEAVGAAWARIRGDGRHGGIAVLRDAAVSEREFGHWSMADRRRGERAEAFDERLRAYLRSATPATRDLFLAMLDEQVAG